MTELTAAEQAILRRTNYRITRYLSFCPREIVFQCKSTAQFDADSKTGGWVAIDYDTPTIGNYGDVQPGMTLDVGALGSVRIRKAATSSKLYIGETGGGDLYGQGFIDDVTMTVHNERRIWPKFPYMNKTATGDYYDTFDYTVDYDVDYTDETDNYPPIVNITGDIAGFVDTSSVATQLQNPASGLSDYFDLNNGAAYAETSYAGATVTASSEYSTYVATNAFDDDNDTYWATTTGAPQWIKLQYTSATTITAYTYIPGATDDYAVAWTLEGSNNDSDWDTLDTVSAANIQAGYAALFEVDTPGSYVYYRFTFTALSNTPYLSIAELNMHESIPAQTQLSQRFTPSAAMSVNYVDVYIAKVGTPAGTLTLSIQTDSSGLPSGSPLGGATATVGEASLSTTAGWVRFTFTGAIALAAATAYHLVLQSSSSESTSNYVRWGYSDGTDIDRILRLVDPDSPRWQYHLTSDFVFQLVATTGGTYRSVTLSAVDSEPVAASATIASYLWDIEDGDFASGYSDSDATIIAQFPDTKLFRYITCTVTDSNGTSATRYYPIFVHSDLYPPLPADVGFKIERDETSMVGREMDVTVYGDVDAATEDVIPEGTLAVYWEDITFDGDAPPSAYRKQFMGWTMRDSTRMSLNRDQYLVTISGPGHWLQLMRGFPMSFLDRDSPTEWYHMADPTDDRAIATILRYFTTFLDLCGLHLSDRTDEWHQPTGSDYAAIKVEKASVWEQVTMLTAEYSGVNGCDTNGDMWLTRHPCMRITAMSPTREAVDNLITLTAADRNDGQPLEIPKQHYKPYGLVQLDGFWWDDTAGINRPGRSKAPGRTPGFGPQEEIKAAQVMVGATFGTANINLSEVAGDWYAWLNSPVKEVSYQLVGNLDVAEPARVEWVTVTDNATIRGNQIDADRFIVERVTINHSFEPGQPPKTITWHISQETDGRRGSVVYIPATTIVAGDWIDPGDWYPDSWTPEPVDGGQWLKGELSQIAIVTDGGDLYTTTNFLDDSPEWTDTGLSFSGTPQQLCANPFSPGYTTGTGAINGWIVTSTNIYYVSDIFGTPSAASQKTFRTPSGSIANHSIDASFGTEGHACVVSYYGEDGVYATYTTDTGSTWSAEAQITAYYQTDTTTYDGLFPACYVSPKTAGLVYTSAFSSNGVGAGYVSTNYGSSWAATNGTNGPLLDPGKGLADDIHIPFAHTNELKAYYGSLVAGVDYTASGWYLGPEIDEQTFSDCSESWCANVLCEDLSDDAYMLVVNFYNVQISGDNEDTIKRMDDSPNVCTTKTHQFTYDSSDHLEDSLDGSGNLTLLIGSTAVGDELFGAGNFVAKTGGEDTNWSDTIVSPIADASDVVAASITYDPTGVTGGSMSYQIVYNINSPNSQAPTDGYALHCATGASDADVSPTDANNNPYGPYEYSRWRITSSPTNASKLMLVGWREGDTGGHIWISTNAGTSWTSYSNDSTNYTRGAISGDNEDVIYVWGKSGAIALSNDGGTTSTSKVGDLSTSDEIIGIMGGVT